nr:immunoglobulin light chain junction region [Macaca mulatta]MOV72583.1 immunoglobulin light chain junction region [Macaca mulatta]MOV73910.1 immunoglobulin light chain junction region [Macaca mulatta]
DYYCYSGDSSGDGFF